LPQRVNLLLARCGTSGAASTTAPRLFFRRRRLIPGGRRSDIWRKTDMIWFFTRGAAQIDIEVHRGPEPSVYTLAVTYPDGGERIERFENAARLVTRALTIQQRLIDEGWMPSSPATGQPIVPRRRSRRGGLAAAAAQHARRTWSAARARISERVAAVFGL
jgi:hypothetical protein